MRTRRRLGICLEEVVEQRLVHAASDVHRLLFAAHGPVKCHVGVTTDQVDLVVKTICKHRGEAFIRDRDLFGCNDVVQVERTNSHPISTSSFESPSVGAVWILSSVSLTTCGQGFTIDDLDDHIGKWQMRMSFPDQCRAC